MAIEPAMNGRSFHGGSADAVIAATEVTRTYGEGEAAVQALRGVSLEIERHRLTAVMGPSGSGKSTLMHILAGLDRPDSGTVTIDGTEITALGDDALTKLRRSHIGFIFQFFNLLPMLTAEENILLHDRSAGREDLDRRQGGRRVAADHSRPPGRPAPRRPRGPGRNGAARGDNRNRPHGDAE
jgi:ABC-type lipoprotein export system ATPase subunit